MEPGSSRRRSHDRPGHQGAGPSRNRSPTESNASIFSVGAGGSGGGGGSGKVIGRYRLGRTLGEGSFGKVKVCYDVESGAKLAVKLLEKKRIKKIEDMERITREMNVLKSLKHPNIVTLHDTIDDPEHIYMVMELVTGGELFEKIMKEKRVSEDEALRYFKQAISAIEYCHKRTIIHRDLKPENLLMTDKDSIKIIDFGLCTSEANLMSTAAGTPLYAAPEVLSSSRAMVGPEVDIWSMGVILYVMVTGQLPFEESSLERLVRMINTTRPNYPSYLSPEIIDLLDKMMTPDPRQRIASYDIRQHPWVRQAGSGFEDAFVMPDDPDELDAAEAEREKQAAESARLQALSASQPIPGPIVPDTPTEDDSMDFPRSSLPPRPGTVSSYLPAPGPLMPEPPCNEAPPTTSRPRHTRSLSMTAPSSHTGFTSVSSSRKSGRTSLGRSAGSAAARRRASVDATAGAGGSGGSAGHSGHTRSRSLGGESSYIASASHISGVPELPPIVENRSHTASRPSSSSGRVSSAAGGSRISGRRSVSSGTNGTPSRRRAVSDAFSPPGSMASLSMGGASGSGGGGSDRSSSNNVRGRSSTIGKNTLPSSSSGGNGSGSGSGDGDETSLKIYRGAFHVSATSDKPADTIMAEVKRVLDSNKVVFRMQGRYELVCEKGSGEKNPVRFEIEISRMHKVEALNVVRFKRLAGDTWAYKALSYRCVSQLRL